MVSRKRETLFNSISAQPTQCLSKLIRRYFGVTEERDGTLFGQFGKEYDYERNVYENGEFVGTGEEETDAAYSWFVFDPETRIIVFNQRNRIGYDQFRNAFVSGYNKRAQEIADVRNAVNMNWLTPADELERIINNTRIISARFNTRPRDMDEEDDGRYAVFNQMLNESDSDRGTLEIKESSNEGLDVSEETIARLVELVEQENNGFNARLVYIESGDEQNFNTRVNPATKTVSRSNDLQQVIGSLIDF